MNLINTREKFISYIMRKLGSPVTQINISPDQVSDRIDDALAFYYTWNMDMIQETIQVHKIKKYDPREDESLKNDEDKINYINENGLPREKYWIDLPNSIVGIIDVKPVMNGDFSNELDNLNSDYSSMLFDFDFHVEQWSVDQLMTGTNYGFAHGQGGIGANGLLDYDMTMRYYDLIKYELRKETFYTYTKFNNELTFLTKPRTNYCLVRCYKVIDYSSKSNLWNEPWFKDYTVALLKIQWGENLRKFKGIAIPGGATVDAEGLMQEGHEEKLRLEEELKIGTFNNVPILKY